jgi:hypothetical protein
MKCGSSRLVVGLICLVIGFIGGELVQHARTGYHSKVLSAKVYPFPLGEVQWNLISESVGMPFLDPGTTVIKWNNRTIFKVQRSFQENGPVAANLKTSESTIEWDDGEYGYRLAIDKISSSASK